MTSQDMFSYQPYKLRKTRVEIINGEKCLVRVKDNSVASVPQSGNVARHRKSRKKGMFESE